MHYILTVCGYKMLHRSFCLFSCFRQGSVPMDTIAPQVLASLTPIPARLVDTGTIHSATVEKCVFYVHPGITATNLELKCHYSALRYKTLLSFLTQCNICACRNKHTSERLWAIVTFCCAIQGFFCPEGTSIPKPCPEGTYSSRSALSDVSECTPCGGGQYCTGFGLVEPSGSCQKGFYCRMGAKSAVWQNSFCKIKQKLL